MISSEEQAIVQEAKDLRLKSEQLRAETQRDRKELQTLREEIVIRVMEGIRDRKEIFKNKKGLIGWNTQILDKTFNPFFINFAAAPV